MCRIFFSFRNKEIKPLLEEFLAQSIHKTKNTPDVNNHRDHIDHLDGFGIAWKQGDKWEIYKRPIVYTDDPNLNAILTNIKADGVIAHIRKKTYGHVSLENTHPFQYDGNIFAQNGKIDDFNKNIELLKQYMYKPFLRKIAGKTDTEFLFFLYLSCMKYLAHKNKKSRNNPKNMTRKKHFKLTEFSHSLYEKICEKTTFQNVHIRNSKYINAFLLLITIFKTHRIELVANIIYSNKNVALISRYIYYDETIYSNKQIPPSLYWNIDTKQENGNILITSEPLNGYDNILFSENSVAAFDYNKNDINILNIE